jgi:hypothetical protein
MDKKKFAKQTPKQDFTLQLRKGILLIVVFLNLMRTT